MPETLDRLRELTEQLGGRVHGGDMMEYDCEHGECLGFGLFRAPAVAVQRALMTSGSVLHLHGHAETETVAVYAGCLEVRLEGDPTPRIVRYGETLTIPPGTPHEVRVVEGPCRMIAITIPASEVYPHGPCPHDG